MWICKSINPLLRVFHYSNRNPYEDRWPWLISGHWTLARDAPGEALGTWKQSSHTRSHFSLHIWPLELWHWLPLERLMSGFPTEQPCSPGPSKWRNIPCPTPNQHIPEAPEKPLHNCNHPNCTYHYWNFGPNCFGRGPRRAALVATRGRALSAPGKRVKT